MANRLALETSAYLRQHAHNPVDWYAWGDEAWERARREDKPVLVSIGYSSCHWCHVMERESFEDPNIARLLNDHVIAIKVDREERPDVDQIYMEAVQRMTGSGGWPLNMFCMPDGRPFMGGTYFPPRRVHNRPSFPEVVLAVARVWRDQRADVVKAAEEVVAALHARPEVTAPDALGRDSLALLVRNLMARADRRHGGFGAAPKPPWRRSARAIRLRTSSASESRPSASGAVTSGRACSAATTSSAAFTTSARCSRHTRATASTTSGKLGRLCTRRGGK